jgi:dolichyl-phosphate-mannose--protein O-mannosyl transferase
MSKQQKMAIFGLIFIFVGLFSPIIYSPNMGNLNYVDYITEGEISGLMMLFLLGVSFGLVVARKYKGLLFTGVVSIGVMVFTLIQLQALISNAKRGIYTEISTNPFVGLADIYQDSFQLQWGFAVLLVGATLLIVSYTISDN